MSDQRTAPEGNPQLVTPDTLSAKMLDALSANMTVILEKTKSDDPVFFLDNLLSIPKSTELTPITEPTPFPSFWIAYVSDNGTAGTINNYVRVRDGTATLWINLNGNRKVGRIAELKLLDPKLPPKSPIHDLLEAMSGYVGCRDGACYELHPEIIHALHRINNARRSEATPPALLRINAKRAKAGIKRRAPFIMIGSEKPIADAAEHQGGGGWQQPAHSRRGHWRQYKTGKRIWIDNYSVHGGSDRGRHYRVGASSQMGH